MYVYMFACALRCSRFLCTYMYCIGQEPGDEQKGIFTPVPRIEKPQKREQRSAHADRLKPENRAEENRETQINEEDVQREREGVASQRLKRSQRQT